MTEIRRGLTNRWRRERERERALGRSECIIREKRANKPRGLEDRGSILYFVYNRKKRTACIDGVYRLQWLGGERISFLVSLVRGVGHYRVA